MSASDSDYSIDWLASDEEYDSPVGLSPDHPDRQKTSLPQPQSLSRETPITIHAGLIGSTTNSDKNCDVKIRKGNSRVKNDRDGNDSSSATPTTANDSWVTETQSYIFFGQQQRQSWAIWTTSPYSTESAFGGKHRQPRKRSHSPGLPVQREGTKPEEANKDKLLARKVRVSQLAFIFSSRLYLICLIGHMTSANSYVGLHSVGIRKHINIFSPLPCLLCVQPQ